MNDARLQIWGGRSDASRMHDVQLAPTTGRIHFGGFVHLTMSNAPDGTAPLKEQPDAWKMEPPSGEDRIREYGTFIGGGQHMEMRSQDARH